MDSRQRFLETLNFGSPDRVPWLEEGIREEVEEEWLRQGLSPGTDLAMRFHFDRRDEIDPDLEPRPYPRRWPRCVDDLPGHLKRLDPCDPARLGADWQTKVRQWSQRDYPLILRVHQGFFLTLGIGEWKSFHPAIYLIYDDQPFVRELMRYQAEFATRLAEHILQQVTVDAALFSEPIGGNHGPLISPKMYADLVLPSYQPLLDLLHQHGIELIILRTYANSRVLLPEAVRFGFNCLWAVEAPPEAMDYLDIRKQIGRDLRLVGGIDSDVLRGPREGIRQAVERIVPLLEQGGYIPLLDGRVRVDVPWESYRYYREVLERITQSTGKARSSPV